MSEILDLDVFAPPSRSVKFTDIEGKILLDEIEKKTAALAALKARPWWLRIFSVPNLKVIIAALERKMREHVHIFDVTFMAFRSSLYLIEHLEQFQTLMQAKESDVKADDYRLILGVISEIGLQTDKALTVDFLYENLSIVQGLMLLSIAMVPIQEYLKSKRPGAAGGAVESA